MVKFPPSYCQNVISGYRCPTRCQSGYYATGYNQCNNMVWVGNFKCYETLPCLSSDVNSVLNNIDLSKVVGIVGDGCDFTIAMELNANYHVLVVTMEQVMLNVLMEL